MIAGLDDYTDAELQSELNKRNEHRRRAMLDDLGPCPECGAPIGEYRWGQTSEIREAPKWQGWPMPPPPELSELVGQEYEEVLRCENGHETRRAGVRFVEPVAD